MGETCAELKADARAHRDLFDVAAAPSADGGEAEALDCNCTD